MKLHKDKDTFLEIIRATAEYKELPEEYIEKDYFVSVLLKEMVETAPGIVFKGGTSLSKCYQLIERFSEDIDINYKVDRKLTNPEKKKLKASIIEAIIKAEMELTNGEEIRSGRDYNEYKVQYPIVAERGGNLKNHLIVETYVFLKSFPYEQRNVGSYILDYLKEEEEWDLIEEFELNSFEISVQRLDRTLIDKVFAICDYFEKGNIHQNSRHLYDIHMLWSNNEFDVESFKQLFDEVTIERARNQVNFSATEGYQLLSTLNRIIDEETYKKDYEDITEFLLFRKVSYDDVIASLSILTHSGLFPEVIQTLSEIKNE